MTKWDTLTDEQKRMITESLKDTAYNLAPNRVWKIPEYMLALELEADLADHLLTDK